MPPRPEYRQEAAIAATAAARGRGRCSEQRALEGSAPSGAGQRLDREACERAAGRDRAGDGAVIGAQKIGEQGWLERRALSQGLRQARTGPRQQLPERVGLPRQPAARGRPGLLVTSDVVRLGRLGRGFTARLRGRAAAGSSVDTGQGVGWPRGFASGAGATASPTSPRRRVRHQTCPAKQQGGDRDLPARGTRRIRARAATSRRRPGSARREIAGARRPGRSNKSAPGRVPPHGARIGERPYRHRRALGEGRAKGRVGRQSAMGSGGHASAGWRPGDGGVAFNTLHNPNEDRPVDNSQTGTPPLGTR